jgi:hypothetical protein
MVHTDEWAFISVSFHCVRSGGDEELRADERGAADGAADLQGEAGGPVADDLARPHEGWYIIDFLFCEVPNYSIELSVRPSVNNFLDIT